jgi:hypothetical protein
LGRICHYGGAWAKSETSAVYERGFDLFGISNLLDVWISDNSKAAAKLAATYERKRHVLCFQHFRQHLWDSIATFNHQVKKSFWSKAMKIMKWRGYSDDATLLQDINSLIAECEPGSRCRELMIELRDLRRKLCIFHVSQCCTMMRVASSIAESTHSAIKGAGEFKKLLRASNFFESMLHILQLMRIYVDDTVADLKTFKDKGWNYSPYARQFVDSAWAGMAQCSRVSKISDLEWQVVQKVPEFCGGKETSQYSLPAYVQTHIVTFSTDRTHPTCTCPEYTQGLRMCAAVCAVLFHLGRGHEHKQVSQLHDIWHLRNHPLWALVEDPAMSFPFRCSLQTSSSDTTKISIPPNDVLRMAILQGAFQEILHGSLKSPHFEQLQDALLKHKQRISGQSLEHPPAFPPQSIIRAVHANNGAVPPSDVTNLSRMSATYNRSSKRRVHAATSRDPMAYSLHKRGVEGAEIQCDCGEKLKNTKHSRHYHCHNNRVHLNWLKSAGADCASVDAVELAPGAIDEGDADVVAAAVI